MVRTWSFGWFVHMDAGSEDSGRHLNWAFLTKDDGSFMEESAFRICCDLDFRDGEPQCFNVVGKEVEVCQETLELGVSGDAVVCKLAVTC